MGWGKVSFMGRDYLFNYLMAVDSPLPELSKTFAAEFELLKSLMRKDSLVLDVGCGVGRPAKDLAPYVKRMVCMDNDKDMLLHAMSRCQNIKGLEFSFGEGTRMDFPPGTFDVVFSTYNLIGSVERRDQQPLVDEMVRVCQKGGKVLTITWKNDDVTTDFLKKYYPSIGIDIHSINSSRTITSKGVFERVSNAELMQYHEKAGLVDLKFIEIGPVWIGIIGTKK